MRRLLPGEAIHRDKGLAMHAPSDLFCVPTLFKEQGRAPGYPALFVRPSLFLYPLASNSCMVSLLFCLFPVLWLWNKFRAIEYNRERKNSRAFSGLRAW
jgi:hypothetical protein